MRNITVSVDEEVYHRARVVAAQKKTSVSALVKRFLGGLASEESEFDRLKREEQELRAKLLAEGAGLSASENVPREALYDRHAFR